MPLSKDFSAGSMEGFDTRGTVTNVSLERVSGGHLLVYTLTQPGTNYKKKVFAPPASGGRQHFQIGDEVLVRSGPAASDHLGAKILTFKFTGNVFTQAPAPRQGKP